MKTIIVNQKITLVRHWFKWYNVQRGFEDWRPLAIGRRYVKQKTISDIAKALDKKYPTKKPLPKILDEAYADKEVAKNKAKHDRAQKKGRD